MLQFFKIVADEENARFCTACQRSNIREGHRHADTFFELCVNRISVILCDECAETLKNAITRENKPRQTTI